MFVSLSESIFIQVFSKMRTGLRHVAGVLVLLFASFLALAVSAFATTFTTTVPGTAITIPATYPQAGGVVIVLEGTNGNVYYQFVNPSTMFQGYSNNGTPAAWQGNPFQIAPTMVLNCGPIVSCSSYLGGVITRMSVRFSAYDGDSQTGMFDFNDLTLRINGSNFGANGGNWSPVQTQNTNLAGTTLISNGTGFGNNTFDTGWFQSTDAAILSNVLSTGTVTASIFDRDPNDNYWDFKQGSDANTTTVPVNVAPGVTLDKASATTSFATVGQIIPYTFTYRNVGSVWINNVAISDPKIAGVVCPAPPTAGTANLDPGEQVVCTGNYTVTQADIDAGQILNTATATGTPQAGALGPVTDSNTIPGPLSAPVVELKKTATPSPFGVAGSTLTYSFTVTNRGNVTLSNVSIADPSLGTLSCTTPSIAPGVTATATCTGNTRTITQANVDAGSIVNTATVTAKAPNGATVTDPDTITTPGPTRTGSMTVVKSAAPIVDLDGNGPDEGDRVNYSFLVTNTGSVTLTGLGVTDNKVGAVTCPATTLAPAATTTCTASYTLSLADVNAGGVTNTATGTATPPAGVTGPVTDVSGTAANNNTPTFTAITQAPKLSVDKTSSTANFDATNDTISYTYLVTNTGNVTITNPVTVSDNKVAVSCPALPGGDLIPGETLTCTATYTPTQADIDAGGVTNIATANTTFGSGNTPVASPSDQVTVPSIRNRSMTVAKSARTPIAFTNPGNQITYDYVVTNSGNTTLTSPISVTDNRISSVACQPMPPGGLAPAATLNCSGVFTVTVDDLSVGTVTNLASAVSGTTTSPQTSVTVPSGLNPALTLTKTKVPSSGTFDAVGDIITYQFSIENTGNASFTRTLRVNDDKIGAFDCWVPPVGGPPANRVFAPGETEVCSGQYTVTQADLDRGFVTNQASASTTFGSGNIPVVSPPVSLTVNATQNPGLTVTKSVATLPITAVGQVLTYTINTRNSGDVTLSSIVVTDPLIPSLSCNIPTLAPTASQNCSGTYSVKQSDFDAGQILNTATANGQTPQGAPVSGNDDNIASITQNQSVTIAKAFVSNADQDGSGTVSLNDTLSYRVTVTNDGNTTQNNVVVSDPLLTPATATCASVAPGGTCVLAGTLNVTQAQVNAGTVANTASVTTTALPTPETATNNRPVPQVSTLTLDKQPPVNGDQDASNSVTRGDVLTYTVIATNAGNVTQTNVVVSDAGLTAASSTTCATLLPGATCVLIGSKLVGQGDVNQGSILNTAQVTSTLITTPVTDSVTTPVAQNSSLAIAKAMTNNADGDGSSSVTRNDVLTYTVTVTNDGTVTQNNVVVSDPKLTAASTTTCATVAPGNACVLTGTLTVSQSDVDQGAIANTASVTSTRLPTPETVALSTPIPQTRSLTIDKTANITQFDSVGDVISYSYLLTNTGNTTLTGAVSVTDDKVAVTCPALPPAGLAPAATHNCTATYTVTQEDLNAGSVTNIASGKIGSTISPTDTLSVDADQLPALTVQKTSPTASFDAVDDEITYSYVVTNSGNVTIINAVTVADDKTTVTCPALPAGGLKPTETLRCSATYKATQADIDAGKVTNKAIANTTFGAAAVSSPEVQAVVPAVQSRRMTVEKSAPAVNFTDVGDTVEYQYMVTNTGNTTLTNPVSVTDNRVSSVDCGTWPTNGLAPNATLICNATYTVLLEDLEIGSITNVARAVSGTPGAPDYTVSPQDAVTVPNGATPALSINKETTTTDFNAVGDTIAYTYIVTNTGDATFTRKIDVIDDKIGRFACWTPTGTDATFLPAVGATPAESVTCTANYTVTQADLDRGFVTNEANADTTYGAANIPVASPGDSVTVNAIQNPELTVTKSAATLPVTAVGQVLTYIVTTRNSGDVTLSNVNITDPLIPSMACNVATLAVGASTTCQGTYTVTQADFDAGQIVNTAAASGSTPQGNPVSDTGALTTAMAAPRPALTLEKTSASSNYQAVGETLSYSFAVTNSGDVTLTNVRVTDPIVPSFLCVIPTLAPGDIDTSCSTSIVITQARIDAGEVVNTASVSATAARGTNPTATDSVTVPGPTREPGITVSKTATPDQFSAVGEVISYDYVISNSGNITLNGPITVTDDKLPSSAITCDALPAGGILPSNNINCSANYIVTQADLDRGSIVNEATARGTTALGPITSAPVTETATANQTKRIALVKTAGAVTDLDGNGEDAGDTVAYGFTVSNLGNVTLTSIGVTDLKVTPVTCLASTLAPGATTTCSATYTLLLADVNAGQVINTATASGAPPSGPAITDASGSSNTNNSPTIKSIARSPMIAVVKTAGAINDLDSNGPDAGDTIQYSFAVNNEGNVTLTSVAVDDPKVGTVTCPSTTLTPATSTTCTATYTLTQADVNAGGVTNTATATANSPAGPVSDASGSTTGEDAPTVTAIGQTPDISIVKTAGAITDVDGNGPDQGDRITYTFVVKNEGNVTLTSVGISDPKVGPVSCPVNVLAPTESTTCSKIYVLTLDDVNAGRVTNTATASGRTPGGATVSDASGSTPGEDAPTVTTIPQSPSLVIDKVATTTSFDSLNDTLSYTYAVSNSGNVTITNAITVSDNRTAVICDPLPAGGLVPGATLNCTATDTVDQADIDAGQVVNTATANTIFGPGNMPVVSPQDQATVPAIQIPSMTVAKTAPTVNFVNIGDLVVYQFVITNTGNTTLPGPFTINDSRIGAVNCPAGNIAPNGTLTCTANYNLVLEDLQIGSVTNRATASNGSMVSPQTSATVPLGASPALTIAKTSATTNFNDLTDSISYQFTVTNSGSATLTNVINVVDDKIGTIACWSPVAGDLTFTPGETAICSASYPVTQADLDRGFVTNQAFADTTYGAGNIPISSPPVGFTVNAAQTPSLNVTKAVATLPVASVGQVLTYTVTAANNGNVTLSNVVMTDPLIPTMSCTAPTIAVGASSNCVGTYRVTQADFDAGQILNTARAAGITPRGAPVVGMGANTATIAQNPSIALVKTAGGIDDLDGNGPDAGDQISYSFTVSNEGNVTLNSIAVTDPKVGVVTCPVTTLGPGLSTVCGATYTLSQTDVDAGQVVNTATVGSRAPNGSLIEDDTATTTTIPASPRITVIKSASAINDLDGNGPDLNDTIIYSFTVANAGNQNLSSVAIDDPALAPSTVSCPATTLAPTTSMVCSATYALKQSDIDAGRVVNTATVSANPPSGAPVSDVSGSNAGNNTPTVSIIPAISGIALTKTAGVPSDPDNNGVDVGDTITYSFSVRNIGNQTLTDVTVTDGNATMSGGPLATLAPGAEDTSTFSAVHVLTQTDIDNGSVVNSARAEGTMPDGTFVRDTSGTASNNDNPTLSELLQAPKITVVKTAGAPTSSRGADTAIVDVGDAIEYSFEVTNTGNVTLSGIAVDDSKVPNVVCALTTLAPTASTTCAGTYTLVQADFDAGQTTNTATVSANPPNAAGPPVQDVSGTDAANDTPTQAALSQIARIALVKTAGPVVDVDGNGADVGDTIRYSFAVTNQGNVTLSAVIVDDPKVGVVSCPVTTLLPTATITCTATYRIAQADLDAGQVVNSAIASGAPPVGARVSDVSDPTDAGQGAGQNDATISSLTQTPRITVVKTAAFNDIAPPTPGANLGDTISYSFVVTNTGNVTVRNVSIVDPMLTNANVAITCPATPLLVNGTMTCIAQPYALTQKDINTGSVNNEAVASADAILRNGQVQSVSDDSGTAGNNDEATVINLPIVQPDFVKRANKAKVAPGEIVTYTISSSGIVFSPIEIVDQLPGDLTFVPGSATLNGAAVVPAVNGSRVTFGNVVPTNGAVTITLKARVNASATSGDITNRARLNYNNGGVAASTSVTIEVKEEPVFDCSDVIGKVFDDANRNGKQDAETSPYQPERGLPGVRLVTVNGVQITTDKNGKFNVPCAAIPDSKTGSNFILKVDPRSLPSGYRLTTENPKVIRLTRGKLAKINFGASISRVIKLDLTDKVFVGSGTKVTPKLKAAIFKLVDVLEDEQSVVRLQYHVGGDGKDAASARMKLIAAFIADSWNEKGGRYKLAIEKRLLQDQSGAEQ